MINLLYHSHTVIPAHLTELEGLGFLEPAEQVLVAFDGILLDGNGQRLSGPTLHDYCIVTDLRVILWARDYARHLCYAFPLAELMQIDGSGVDPIHGQIQLVFVAPEEEEQHFTLTLLPVVALPAALTLLRAAADAAQTLAGAGVDAREAAAEIVAVLSAQIYGHVDGVLPGAQPYRWPGAEEFRPLSPGAAFQHNPGSLPPGQVYTAGRLARSAWDTLRRSLREAELPFDLSSGSLRELTEAVRAINELVHTVSSNPNAQQMAMAFLNRQTQAAAPAEAPRPSAGQSMSPSGPAEVAPEIPEPATSDYHEIPLRRRGSAPARVAPPVPAAATTAPPPVAPPPDRREIPLRRRSPAPPAHARSGLAVAVSGSGDAESEQ